MIRANLIGVALGSALVLASCSGSGIEASGVCAEHDTGQTAEGEPVAICEALFTERPYVRPPADERLEDEASMLHLAAIDIDHTMFIDRDGVTYRATIGGDPVSFGDDVPEWYPEPSNRMLFLIYRVSGTVTPSSDPAHPDVSHAIDVTSIDPAILIEGRAIDGRFLGTWEGSVTVRAPDDGCTLTVPCWDTERTTPLRVTFSAIEAIENMGAQGLEAPLLEDGERFELSGTVDNLTASVQATDGSCMPALESLGDASPFRPSTTGDLTLFRYPGMHAPGDLQLVMDYPDDTEGMGGANGMSALNVLHPANLLQATDVPEWTGITIRNHGTPNGSEIELRPIVGGGEPCER